MSLFNSLIPTFNRAQARGDGTSTATATLKPRYEVAETPEAYSLTVYLPGVSKDGLEITAEEDQIRISGRKAWKQPEGWTSLHRESVDAPYELVLEHGNGIDPEKIQAELKEGVLRATLPKAEALKPRKIAVS